MFPNSYIESVFPKRKRMSFNSVNQVSYQVPPENIQQLIDTSFTPRISIAPDNQWFLLCYIPSLPQIEVLSQPEIKLAGIKINPENNVRSQHVFYNRIQLINIEGDVTKELEGLPHNPKINNIKWAPDGRYISFFIHEVDKVTLWIADRNTAKARCVNQLSINQTLVNNAYTWFADSKTILLTTIPEKRGNKPKAPRIPLGPIVKENDGVKAQVRTYQNLLKSPYDEQLFDYYGTSELVKVNIETGEAAKLGIRGMIKYFSLSPNNKYVMVKTIHHPYSYLVPFQRFPHQINIWSLDDGSITKLVESPLAEDIPVAIGSVRKGPRSFGWRPDKPAMIYWVTALDQGDASIDTPYRDQLFFLNAPFKQEETIPSICLELRFGGIDWLNGDTAIVQHWWWKNRREVTALFAPEGKNNQLRTLFDVSWEDRYNHPGIFITQRNTNGKLVLLSNKEKTKLYLSGEGASPKGNHPFLDELDLKTLEKKRLWQSQSPFYERLTKIIGFEPLQLILARETETEPTNFIIKKLQEQEDISYLTHFPHPYPQLKKVKKEIVKFNRADGIELSATLYLPPNYNKEKDKPLPVLIWAYPREFKSAKAAGQVKESPHQFTRMGPSSPLYFLSSGYAILQNPSMPIIGEAENEPNDHYIPQLIKNAEAAVNFLVESGVGDKDRIAIGGHSYGAFMTANLLAHTKLFAAGIARSGAYNRTLTPFGFQSEERTLWEASETYITMSPFLHADKVKSPILLIHGAEDSNSGTYPMQSERFYSALKGHGAIVRLVMLPHEGHGYIGLESVQHMLWEMYQWLEKHVKNRVINKEKTDKDLVPVEIGLKNGKQK